MRLGIFVGSFNPVHKGHIEIVNYVLNNNYVDKVLIIPTGNYWDKNNIIDVKYRIDMLNFFKSEKIIISENYSNYKYTYQIIEKLKEKYSNDVLYLMLGSDNLSSFDKWKNYKELIKLNFIIYRRDKNDLESYLDKIGKKDKYIILDGSGIIDISSTKVRNYINLDKNLNELLDKRVIEYIKDNKLYKEVNMEEKIVNKLINNKETISSMESCTAGYFATTITNVDGSSNVLKFSAITYSNEYKVKMGVNQKTIDKYSVYSFEVTHEMSKCICKFTSSTYGVGISGKINRYDEFNPGGSNNEIYATIYNSKNNTYKDIFITCPNKKRKDCKEYIVNKVLEELNLII